MGMEAIVALVLAVTQTVKSWIKSWFNIPDEKWKKWFSVALSFLVSVGVVVYDALKTGAGLNLELIWTIIGAFALANGAKKLINTVRPTS
jgi:hypothetical protein